MYANDKINYVLQIKVMIIDYKYGFILMSSHDLVLFMCINNIHNNIIWIYSMSDM